MSGKELNYSNWVEREIFVPNNRDVNLSFYLNIMKGFSGNDTFAVTVYNMQRSQAIVISTPNGIHESYPNTATISQRQALFSFDLTKLWQQAYNSTFPEAFVLKFANSDVDGVPNIAYVDDITVTYTSMASP